MTQHHHPLDTVIGLAERRRDSALAALAHAQREQRHAQDQMQQLQGYANEAEQRWAQRGAAGVSAALIGHHRQFMAKLDHAMDFQRGVLVEREHHLQQAQTAAHAAERELAGLRKLLQQRQAERARQAVRREQKATDELAQGLHRRRQDNDSRFHNP